MGKTFYGQSNVDPHVEPNIHESPKTMTVPLILLAIPSAVLGLVLGGGLLLGQQSMIGGWLEPVFHHASEVLHLEHHPFELLGIDGALLLVGAAAGAIGVALGIWLFGLFRRQERRATVERWTERLEPLYRGSFNKWYFDDLNHLIFIRFGGFIAKAMWWFDVRVVDGTVNGVASLTQSTGRGIRQIQTGRVQNYALGIAAGLLVIAVTYMFVAR
jgi:NADH:ubiquinone oxidoreductase subunit 5 (subunit L)/multisubunit Na+/H+ antiporter MnhA subunit